ncbi:MAG: hypothetical protein KKD18_02240, partial [Nanoarchaeota archaeon]|nr:hypothetical protein [Nanoarchaeota archaeon]
MKRWLVVCLFVFGIALFFNLLVSAEHIVSLAGGENSTNVDEDGSYFCNISVEILDDGQDANVTEVNVTLPTNFTLAAETNGTDFVGEFFVDGNVLSWQNFTDYAVNGTATQYFWFNTTASVPGSYNITVT